MEKISGLQIKEIFISGANNLFNHYPEIDALNVFPVPDGDTGMNMNLTMASGAKQIENLLIDSASAISESFAKGLLLGARGNSGVITSQIFRGFSQGVSGKEEISSTEFVNALRKGSDVAYKAVMRPVEGTILTVIRESTEGLKDIVNDDFSLEDVLKELVKLAKESLNRTPDLLPVLKEVGVVDSGGAGLVKIFEGMLNAAKGKPVARKSISRSDEDKSKIANVSENIEFGYCTEFILRFNHNGAHSLFNENRFKTYLESRGNSIVMVNYDDILKVHVHTMTPGSILNYAQNYGEFVTVKVENMSEQHSSLQSNIVPEEVKKEPQKEVGIISICSGKGVEDLFTEMGADEIVSGGQTMNPSTEDIVNAIKKTNAKNVFIFPNNSNILMSSYQAADVIGDDIKVYVVPTKTIPEGLVGISTINTDVNLDDNFDEVKEAIKNIKSGAVTYSIKDTVIDGVEVTKNYFMGMCGKKIYANEKHSKNALYKLLENMVGNDNYLLTILVGCDVEQKEFDEVQKKVGQMFPDLEIDIKKGDQPVYSYLIGLE